MVNVRIICDHSNNVHPDTVKDIFEHIENGWPFVLSCDVSAVIFIPVNLLDIWVPGNYKQQYPNLKNFIDGVNLQLVSHFTFTSLKDRVDKLINPVGYKSKVLCLAD